MKNKIVLLTLFLSISFIGCKKKTTTEKVTEIEEVEETTAMEPMAAEKKITVTMQPKSDSKAGGSIVFKEEDGVVKMTAIFDGLEEGTHAIHLHETADCSSEDGTSSGGHWNPTAAPHGKWGDSTGYHRGDIGNFEVDANGNGTINFSTDEWCISCADTTKNIVGRAVIVHQGTDDFTSQPSGAAGKRVLCGEITE